MTNALDTIVNTPIYEDILPSTGAKIKFRPFVVAEERALLMAQESDDTNTMLNTLSSVVRECIVGPKPRLSTFDLEYMFVKIRMKSVDEISTLIFTCNACNEKTPINVPLKNVKLKKEENHSTTVKLSDDLFVIMEYPTVEDLTSTKNSTSEIAACMKQIYKGDSVIDASDFTNAQLVNFIDTKLTGKQFAEMKKFYETIPEVVIDLEWKCPSCGHQHNQVLRGLNDFF